MKQKVVFRADANPEIGAGHVYRLLAIAEMIEPNFKIEFLTKKATPQSLFPTNVAVKRIPEFIEIPEEPTWLRKNYSMQETIYVLDGYTFNYSYEKKLRSDNGKVVAIYDHIKKKTAANIVINHALSLNETEYTADTKTTFLLGGNYALVRKLFTKTESVIKKDNTVFLCIGAADKFNISSKIIEALHHSNYTGTINVVAGNFNKNDKLVNSKSNILVHKRLNAGEMKQLIAASTVAITSASTVSYEVCSQRIPLLCGYYVENQKLIYEGLRNNNIIFPLGNLLTFNNDSFMTQFNRALESDLSLYQEQVSTYFDNNQSKRLTEAFIKLWNN